LSFGSIAPQISELRGIKNRPFPFTRHIAYTTACCYRTSRDVNIKHTLTNCEWLSMVIRHTCISGRCVLLPSHS